MLKLGNSIHLRHGCNTFLLRVHPQLIQFSVREFKNSEPYKIIFLHIAVWIPGTGEPSPCFFINFNKRNFIKAQKREHNREVSLCPLTFQINFGQSSIIRYLWSGCKPSCCVRYTSSPKPNTISEDDDCPITHCIHTCRNAVIIHAQLIYCPFWWIMLYTLLLACLDSICKFDIRQQVHVSVDLPFLEARVW